MSEYHISALLNPPEVKITMKKIVILDGYTLEHGDLGWDALKKLGTVKVYDRTPEDKVIERIGDAEIVITNKTPVRKKTIDTCPSIEYIGVLATGYDVVDVKAASEKNIPVTNIPTYGTDSVAQFAIALLLELCHRIGAHSEEVKKGRWKSSGDFCFWDHPLVELSGKTMGIIGLGRIGQRTAVIAAALGMKVLAYDPFPNKSLENESLKYESLDNIFSQSDALVLHTPLTDETREIICRKNIDKMKKGVFIINNSRGPLVNEKDLYDALVSGKIAGAALDVASKEPIEDSNQLLKLDNCIITPHISWAPIEARKRLMKTAVENLESFLKGNPVNTVN